MYEDSGNTRVTLLAISMGGPVSHNFLTRVVNQEWKDTYIYAYVLLVAPWFGSNGLAGVLSPPVTNTFLFFQTEGRNYSEELLALSRSYASAFWLSPRAAVWGDTVLISTPVKNYTASDYEQLFTDAGYPQGYTQLSDFDVHWPPPNVPTYCFYGLGFPTPLTYIYNAGLPDAQLTAII